MANGVVHVGAHKGEEVGEYIRQERERYPDRASAKESAEGLERMGYPALVHDTKLLDSIGLPETFDATVLL